MKIDSVVRRETVRVAGGTFVLTGLMLLIYIILGKISMPVIFGALFGTFGAVLNFFLMAYGVQKAADQMQGVIIPPEETDEEGNVITPDIKKEEAPEITNAKGKLRLSYTGRMVLTAAFAILGIVVPFFDSLAAILPLLFPRPVISVLHLIDTKKGV